MEHINQDSMQFGAASYCIQIWANAYGFGSDASMQHLNNRKGEIKLGDVLGLMGIFLQLNLISGEVIIQAVRGRHPAANYQSLHRSSSISNEIW
jgi:hypothetical protein